MNKEQFLHILSDKVKGLPENERIRLKEYYEEVISDRIEDGMSEDEAIAAMGDINESIHGLPQKNADGNTGSESSPLFFHEPVRSIEADCKDINLHVRSGNIDGAFARVSFDTKERVPFTCTMEDGCLSILPIEPTPDTCAARLFRRAILGLGVQNVTCTIILSNPNLENVILNARSGNVSAEVLRLSGDLIVHSGSGNVKADTIVSRNCKLEAGSGSIKADTLQISGDFSAVSGSGSIKADTVETNGSSMLRAGSGSIKANALRTGGNLTIESGSGSIKASALSSNGKCCLSSGSGSVKAEALDVDSVHAKTQSGSINICTLSAHAEAALSSISGSIRLERAKAELFDLATRSGSISGSLIGNEDTYDIRTNVSSGSVSVPQSRGQKPVKASTASGSIRLAVEPE